MELVAPRTRDLAVLAGQLSGWLGRRISSASDIRVENLSYPSGAGMSHETILFDAIWTEDGQRTRQRLVVRIKPVANMVFPDDLFDRQYRVMRLIFERAWAPVAEPLWFEDDADVIGAPFFVMRKVEGRVPVSRPPYALEGWIADASPAQRARLWENAVRQLAAIHRMPLAEFAFLEGPAHGRSGLDQEWDKYMRFVAWVSGKRRWTPLDAAVARLRERWPEQRAPGFVWGGAEMVNMMFDDDFQVAAVMDWEQPSLGGSLNDLGWWLVLSDIKHSIGSGRPHLEGMGTREETIALWGALTGIPTDDVDWYEDFTRLKLACLAIRSAEVWGLPTPTEETLERMLKRRAAG